MFLKAGVFHCKELIWVYVKYLIGSLLTRSCKLLLVVNVAMLCGAAGGKVSGQKVGDCGGSHVDVNTIAV